MSLCCGLGVFSIFLCRGCFWIAGSFFLSVGRNALLTRAWRLCWAGRACAGSPQNTKACVTVNNRDMLKSVLWCWRAQLTGDSDQGSSLGGPSPPPPLCTAGGEFSLPPRPWLSRVQMDPLLGEGAGSSGRWGLGATCVPAQCFISLFCCISLEF